MNKKGRAGMDNAGILWEFCAEQSDDDLKHELELRHEACGERVCDIDPGDNMGTLFSMMRDHHGGCPARDEER